jgi:hypothetical protein
LEKEAGGFPSRKNRVAGITELGRVSCGELRYLSASVALEQGYMNPTTAVAVGVCYRVSPNFEKGHIGDEGFLNRVSEAVRREGVRFLGGIFDCSSDQAAVFARSCGALFPSPYTQVFKETPFGRTRFYFHPAFLFVIGPANRQLADIEDQPERPRWLLDCELGRSSALVRAMRDLEDLPKWETDTATFNQALPHLGNVRQKPMDTKWEKPWIHQLLLYVGTARQGKAARRRHFQKARASRA